MFFETPSNPMQVLVDIQAVADLAHAVDAQVVVDNVFGTPVFPPLQHGPTSSSTRRPHIDGGGRALGGAISPADFITGPVKNPCGTPPGDVAVQRLGQPQGPETLRLRVEQQARSALALAELRAHPRVDVRHPWLRRIRTVRPAADARGRPVVTFTIDGSKADASR